MKKLYINYGIINLITVSKLTSIYYFEFEKDYRFSGESHNFWELVYVDRGEIIATASDKEIVVRQGEVLFHEPNEFHGLRANSLIASNVFIMGFVSKSVAMNYFRQKKVTLKPDIKVFLSALIREAQSTFDIPSDNSYVRKLRKRSDSPEGGVQMVRLYLEQFLIMIMRAEENKGPKKITPIKEQIKNEIVFSTIQLLEENIYGKISVKEICETLCFSRTYLSKIFKKYTNESILEYYIDLKIQEAKYLIREKNYNYSQIANLLKFDNPQYFTRVFKRITGMSPKEYQASIHVDC